jgi:hypothetical protein
MRRRRLTIEKKSNSKNSQEVEAVEEAAVAEEALEAAEVETVVVTVIVPRLKEETEEVDTAEAKTEIKMRSMSKRMMEWDTLSQSTIRSQEETKRRTWHSILRTIPSSESRGSLTLFYSQINHSLPQTTL